VILRTDDVLHPRGRIWPPLPESEPPWRRLGRAVVRLGQGLYYHDVFRAAPAMAFHFFLSLLPLLVFVGYAIGTVARSRGITQVFGAFLDNLPAISESVLKDEINHLANDSIGALAAIGFLWIASGGIHGLMDTVEMVVGAPRRAWWKQRLFSLGWVVATLAAFAVAAFGIIGWDGVSHLPIVRGGVARALTMAFSFVVSVGGLSAFYRFAVTHSERVRRRVIPGAVLAVSLWVVVSWGFSVYLRTLGSYAVYYGSLAAVAVLLIWLWLVSLAILIGAELNSQLEGIRDAEPDP
jgi:membrane protein